MRYRVFLPSLRLFRWHCSYYQKPERLTEHPKSVNSFPTPDKRWSIAVTREIIHGLGSLVFRPLQTAQLFPRMDEQAGRTVGCRLLPHENRNAPIQCQLFDYSLQESDKRMHLYDALSYVWANQAILDLSI
jgi:hypothetical protein